MEKGGWEVKLKYYNGGMTYSMPGDTFNGRQKHCTVIAKSAKRALEIIRQFDPSVSMHYLRIYYSCMDTPPRGLFGKPCEESLWVSHGWDNYTRIFPDIKEVGK